MQIANRPRNQYLPVAGGAAGGLAFASNQYRNLYRAYNLMRRNWRSGRTKSRFSKNLMISRVNQRVARKNALMQKRSNATFARGGLNIPGTNIDSQYVGRFNGRPIRYVKDKISYVGYRKNVETTGVVESSSTVNSGDGPARMVVQAVHPPQILYTVAVAFLRKIMKRYYNKEYEAEDQRFMLQPTLNYEVPYQISFGNLLRSSQTAATVASAAVYTPGFTDTLATAAQWVVDNVFLSLSFTGNNILNSITMDDRVNATLVRRKDIKVDRLMKVKFYSKVDVRIQNTSNGTATNSTDVVGVVPVHGNIVFSKGFSPRMKADNSSVGDLVPFTWEDTPNGVIIPKTYLLSTWYSTITPINGFYGVERAVPAKLGAGQIRNFSMYYTKTIALGEFISKFRGGSVRTDLTGTDSYGFHSMNRNALIQLEKYIDTNAGEMTVTPARFHYHCEWEMGATVSVGTSSYLPKGYAKYYESTE